MMTFEPLRRFCLYLWLGAFSWYMACKYVIRHRLNRRFGFGNSLRFQNAELKRRDGCTAIVTGGSRGIGLEVVHSLLEHGYYVIIGSSSSENNRMSLEKELRKDHPQSKVEVWELDLVSQKSVKDFVNKFLSQSTELHLLINNAGIMFVPEKLTEDGIEQHFAVNYLSHCLLTMLLLPVLQKSGSPQHKSYIINATSCIHYVGHLNFEDLQCRENYFKYFAYMQSKLAQVMFTYSLHLYVQRKSYNINVNCCHPGIVNTDLMNCEWWVPCVAPIFKTAKQGAETIIYIALSGDMENVSGKHLADCSIVESSKRSQDSKMQDKLWCKTLALIRPHLSEEQYNDLLSYTNHITTRTLSK